MNSEKSQILKDNLIVAINSEMKEEEQRYGGLGNENLKQLKSEGIVLHPISVNRKRVGYAEYPEIDFRIPFHAENSLFRENSAIECFFDDEERIKGILLGFDGVKGTFRLLAPDFPDWIEEKGVGIKLAPDHFTSKVLKFAVNDIANNAELEALFQKIHGNESFGEQITNGNQLDYFNSALNDSQKTAVEAIISTNGLSIVHGPPGTGKTTTIVEGIQQLIRQEKTILVSASSNSAVDNVAKKLIEKGVNVLRVGNMTKVDEIILPHTLEGKIKNAKEFQEIKKLKIKAEELRKLSYQYKRNFGRDERAQRKLLISEVKKIRAEIKNVQSYFEEKTLNEANVIIGTPIGIHNFLPKEARFDFLFMDEAGQSVEPFAWLLFKFSQNWVLAGDPFQLPPTVLSSEANKMGYSISILEHAFKNCKSIYFLDTQYRMRESIANFSSKYFYENGLKTPERLKDESVHFLFYDTAGTGFNETSGANGVSLSNDGELSIINQLIEVENLNLDKTAFISPYSGQVNATKESKIRFKRISTIDSFQGQEMDTVLISLVRSNLDSEIGFLKDYRRMNVALTRAKEKLIVIGDSATIGQDSFYASFIEYVEKIGGYRSAWELM